MKVMRLVGLGHLCLCLSDSFAGELLIANHSVDLVGIYACEASNAVGKEMCRINLQANKRECTRYIDTHKLEKNLHAYAE